MAVYKNKASQKVPVFAVDSTGAPKTGDAANITAYISKDGATATASNDTNPTELSASNAPGVYLFDLLQAETNCDLMVIAPKSATSGVVLRPLFIFTEPELRDTNTTQVATGAITSASFATGAITAGAIAADAIGASELAADAVAEIADAVWDEPYTGHVQEDSFGLLAHPLAHGQVSSAGTSTVVLDGDASSVNNYYDGAVIQIVSGPGAGQSRVISAYNGTNKTATLTEAWATQPTNSSKYSVLPLGDVEVGIVGTGAIAASSFAAGAIDSSAIAADAIGSSELAATAVTEIAGGVRTELATELGRIDAAVSTRSTLTAQQVWEYATRTLSSFGSLVSDVWSAVSRTITGGTIGTYTGNTPQTGDSFARLGAPAGASLAADVAGIPAAVMAQTSDSVSVATILKVLMAALIGKATVAGNTVSFKGRDGTTTVVSVTVGESAGERTSSVVS
jgi:hypothetical protein